jgi:hypothetical protein
MDTGYDPWRIQQLARRTTEAIDHLAGLSSSDPAAADAMRAVRLTRTNLEDIWMPALRDIERGAPMVRWVRRRPSTAPWRGAALGHVAVQRNPGARHTARPLSGLDDDRLIDLLLVIDGLLGDADVDGRRSDTFDLGTLPAKYDPDELAAELAHRVDADPAFARRLVSVAPETVILGQLAGRAPFPTRFLTEVARALAGPTGARASRAPDEHARSMSSLLRALADDRHACLDLLRDDVVLFRLATWDRLDAAAVADFVTVGLLADADEETGRLDDGFDVLRRLTEFSTGTLDGGMTPGMARGLALAMPAYVPLLADAIFQTGGEPVRVSRYQLTLGTYDEVANLFGAVLRDGPAAGAVGLALGAFTDSRLTREGVDLTDSSSLTDVVHLTLLLDHAAESEQTQLVMEAAAAEAGRRGLGNWIGVGASVALSASGAGAAWRAVASVAIRAATDAVADVDAERLAGASIQAQQYQLIWMSTMSVALDRDATRRAAEHDPRIRGRLGEFRGRLAEIDVCTDLEARDILIADLRYDVDGTVVADFVDGVMERSGLSAIR